jgi:hypothetical protein
MPGSFGLPAAESPRLPFQGVLEGDVLHFDPWHHDAPVHFRCVLGVDRLMMSRIVCTGANARIGIYNGRTRSECEVSPSGLPTGASPDNVVSTVVRGLSTIRSIPLGSPTGRVFTMAGYPCEEHVCRIGGPETMCLTKGVDVPLFSTLCQGQSCVGFGQGLILGWQNFGHSSDQRPSEWMQIVRVEVRPVDPRELEIGLGC